MTDGGVSLSREPTFLETYRLPLLLAGISIFCLIFSLIILFRGNQPKNPIIFSSDASQSAVIDTPIAVDVEGAVVRPGVYKIGRSSRVGDALDAAGGLASDADFKLVATMLNRAAFVTDGMKIYVPVKDESVPIKDEGKKSIHTNSGLSVISVNSASISELDTLSGIGPVTAQKIIDGRPYSDLGELVTRKIISQSVFEKIKDKISLW